MSLIDPAVSLAARRERGTERGRALRFGAVMATVVGGLGLWKLYRNGASGPGQALVVVAASFFIYSVVHPAGALTMRRAWMRVGEALGRVNSVILLAVLYIGLVTPIGLLVRLFSRRAKVLPKGGSYLLVREPRDDKHFEHPY